MPAVPESASSDQDGLAKKVQEEGLDAVAETVAGKVEKQALDEAFQAWQAPGEAALGEDVQILDNADAAIHVAGIGEPSEWLLSRLKIPDSDLLSSIIENAPVGFIDGEITVFKRVFEIAGIAVSIATGNPLLASACFKYFIHDEIHHMLVEGIKELITRCLSSKGEKSPTMDAQREQILNHLRLPSEATRNTALGEAARRRTSRGVARPRSAPVPPADVPTPRHGKWPAAADAISGEAGTTGVRPRIVVSDIPARTVPRTADEIAPAAHRTGSQPAEATGLPASTAAPARTALTTTALPGGKSIELRGTHETIRFGPRAGQPHPGPVGQPATAGTIDGLTFVRLRVYYETENQPVSGDDHSQPARLKWLVVVRDSRRFLLPHSEKMTTGEMIDFIARKLERAASTRAWQLQSHEHDSGVTMSLQVAAGLLNSLTRTLVGHPIPYHDGLLIREIATSNIHRFPGSNGRCVTIIGLLNHEKPGNLKLQCLASKAQLHDGFSRIIISGLTE